MAKCRVTKDPPTRGASAGRHDGMHLRLVGAGTKNTTDSGSDDEDLLRDPPSAKP